MKLTLGIVKATVTANTTTVRATGGKSINIPVAGASVGIRRRF